MATTPAPVPAESAQTGTLGRMIGALLNPRSTFEDIVHRPSWVAPIVLLSILSLAVTTLFSQRVGWEQFMRKNFEQSPRTAQMTPEQRQQALDRAVPIAKTIGYIGATIGYSVIALLLAAIFLGVFNLIAGAGLRYNTSLGIVAHALMPGAISGVLAIVLLYLKDPDTIDLEHLVGSNLGTFLGSDTPRWLITLASSIDLFAFWIIFLLATGFSVASPKKVTMGKALGVIVGLWAAYVLVKVGWAAAFS